MTESAGRVVVVGAGLAGLGAAWRLARLGCEVTVLEREPRAGGRARAARRDGFPLEARGALLSTADRELLAWIGELGLRDELLPLRPLTLARVHRGRAGIVDPRGLAGIARIPGLRRREALRLLRLPRLFARYAERVDSRRPELAADLDDRSIADFGRLYFGRSVVEHWMEPLVARTSLAEAQRASRALFLLEYAERGARLGLPRGLLGDLCERAAARLPLRLGVEVARVECPSRGAVRVTWLERGRERSFEADAAVVATPAPEALRLAAGELLLAERDELASVVYQPALSLAVALRRPLARHPQLLEVPVSEGSPLESVVLESGVAGERVPAGRGLALLRARGAWSEACWGAGDDVVRKELLDAFERVVPGSRGAGLFAEVVREPRAAPRFDVGRYRRLARFTRVQASRRAGGRRLYLAGDYRMGAGPCAALRSGYRAARDVAADLGLAASPGPR